MRRILQLILEDQGYQIQTATDGADGILKIKTFRPDLILTDLKMPVVDGMAVLKHVNLKYPEIPVIILTAFGTIPTAVDSMKKGAVDYITKPVDNNHIIQKIKTVLKQRASLPSTVQKTPPLLIGSSAMMKKLKKELELVANTPTSVLITGESGTGKELAARTIQAISARQGLSFVKVNCAAIPSELIESELFGHVKGAFTGAVQTRKGAFLEADKGTLFLDEIGDLPYESQAKLLHAVEDKIVTPVGSSRPVKVDVKIISATNQNLKEMVEKRLFRSDLYFRLNTYNISIPPLKERPEDIPELTDHFLGRISHEFGQGKPPISQEVLDSLISYSWPGNIRELKNVLEHLVLVAKGQKITRHMAAHLVLFKTDPKLPDESEKNDLPAQEKTLILKVLTDCGWNISKAARNLGITRNTLRYRIKKYHLQPKP